jgi:hypothetical protein
MTQHGCNIAKDMLFVCLVNTTFNNISVIVAVSFIGEEFKPEYPEKTTDLSQVSNNLNHIMLYTSP